MKLLQSETLGSGAVLTLIQGTKYPTKILNSSSLATLILHTASKQDNVIKENSKAELCNISLVESDCKLRPLFRLQRRGCGYALKREEDVCLTVSYDKRGADAHI